ncbi:MAG: hypothetical protein GEU80_15050 [Dehalococcoidia bacterium]|nr:hypothetical protein [Dehalococcoidia bacterium]
MTTHAARILLHLGTCGHAAGGREAGEALRRALGERAATVEAACDGACWAAPAATVQRHAHVHRHPHIDRGLDDLLACAAGICEAEAYASPGARGLTARLGRNDGTLGDVRAQGAYAALARALKGRPRDLIDAVERAGLTSRGGVASPVAGEWWRASAQAEQPRVLLVDAKDGAPEVFRHRHLLEGDPHRLIEGVLMAAYATGATEARVCIDAEARRARASFEAALEDAVAAGILDGSAFGHGLDVRIGVTGDIDGPPPGSPSEATVRNDAETLCAVTTLFDDPPPPTRLVSLSGDVPRPGLYEVPVDGAMSWTGVLAMAGANPQRAQALLLGGRPARLVTRDTFEGPLEAHRLGAGGVVVLGPDADLASLSREAPPSSPAGHT